jgi:hypothetical protein
MLAPNDLSEPIRVHPRARGAPGVRHEAMRGHGWGGGGGDPLPKMPLEGTGRDGGSEGAEGAPAPLLPA